MQEDDILISLGDHSARIAILESKIDNHICTQDSRICKLELNIEMIFGMIAKVNDGIMLINKDITKYRDETAKALHEAKSNRFTTIWGCVIVIISMFFSMLGFYLHSSEKVFDQFSIINKEISIIKYQYGAQK
jgi:hypothetical protein